MRAICVAMAWCLGWGSVVAAEPVKVMVLGAYHFGNPGLDVSNARVDDVLAPKRQAEVRAAVDALAAFRPTRVAVEALADDRPGAAMPAYRAYRAGEGRDVRNESNQIG